MPGPWSRTMTSTDPFRHSTHLDPGARRRVLGALSMVVQRTVKVSGSARTPRGPVDSKPRCVAGVDGSGRPAQVRSTRLVRSTSAFCLAVRRGSALPSRARLSHDRHLAEHVLHPVGEVRELSQLLGCHDDGRQWTPHVVGDVRSLLGPLLALGERRALVTATLAWLAGARNKR